MTFSIRLAGLPIGITCTENLAVSRFADYFTDETPVFSVETTKEDPKRARAARHPRKHRQRIQKTSR